MKEKTVHESEKQLNLGPFCTLDFGIIVMNINFNIYFPFSQIVWPQLLSVMVSLAVSIW